MNNGWQDHSNIPEEPEGPDGGGPSGGPSGEPGGEPGDPGRDPGGAVPNPHEWLEKQLQEEEDELAREQAHLAEVVDPAERARVQDIIATRLRTIATIKAQLAG